MNFPDLQRRGVRGIDYIIEDIFSKLTPKPVRAISLWRRRCRAIYVAEVSGHRWFLIYLLKAQQAYSAKHSIPTYKIWFGEQCLFDKYGKDSNYLANYKLPHDWTFPPDYAAFLNKYVAYNLSNWFESSLCMIVYMMDWVIQCLLATMTRIVLDYDYGYDYGYGYGYGYDYDYGYGYALVFGLD